MIDSSHQCDCGSELASKEYYLVVEEHHRSQYRVVCFSPRTGDTLPVVASGPGLTRSPVSTTTRRYSSKEHIRYSTAHLKMDLLETQSAFSLRRDAADSVYSNGLYSLLPLRHWFALIEICSRQEGFTVISHV